jgi:hypothetical protein
MIAGIRQHAGDDPTLIGHLEALFDAKPFDAREHHSAARRPIPTRIINEKAPHAYGVSAPSVTAQLTRREARRR